MWCSIPGCTKPVRGRRSTMCEKHRQRRRRHGEPEQATISKAELKPYREEVEKTIERDRSGKILAGLEKLKGIMEGYARGVVSDYEHGRPMVRNRVDAARKY